MPIEVVATICSKKQDPSIELLPALLRYKGSHVRHVAGLARDQRRPLYLLSGKHGFIPGDEPIATYDFLLKKNHVQRVALKIEEQFRLHRIETVYFYTKDKPAWKPYYAALLIGAREAGVIVQTAFLPNNL